MKTLTSNNILFITGAFVHNSCWADWQKYFENEGYTTSAPAWPHKDASSAAELRDRQPNDTELASLSLKELVDYYVDLANGYPEKPVVIGHSMGGLIAQIILNRDLAAACVAIHPVPPQGIIPYEYTFLKAGWKSLGLFTSLDKTYLMSFSDWQYAFVNGMPEESQKAAYDQFTIPESKRTARGALTAVASVDFHKPHAPLLITAGSEDTIIPAHLNERNFEKYHRNGSSLTYKEFNGRNHFVLGQATWKEDADYILEWLDAL